MKSIAKFFFFKLRKKFLIGLATTGGRNFLGRVCVYHKGSGNKRRYCVIDRFRRLEQSGFVLRILKNSLNTAFIGLILYDNGLASFIILSDGVDVGSRIFSGCFLAELEPFRLGSSFILKNIGLFSVINSVELFPFSGSKIARAAGTSAYIVGKDFDKIILKLNSGWQIRVSSNSMASLGIVSNPFFIYKNVGKAGKNRALGVKPTVRGVIKNPCDHPHGGGEGRGSPPVAPVSPWGFLTKGTPTKNRKVDRIKRPNFKSL